MPTATPPLDLAQRIQQLLDQRQQHADALAEIDQTLARIKAALQPTATSAENSATPQAVQSPMAKARKRVKWKKFALPGRESIMAFVKARKNPTTQEIRQHWDGEGRGGTPDSDMSFLVKDGKLRREPLKEGRGSRYLLA
jgi:hypothetical protein